MTRLLARGWAGGGTGGRERGRIIHYLHNWGSALPLCWHANLPSPPSWGMLRHQSRTITRKRDGSGQEQVYENLNNLGRGALPPPPSPPPLPLPKAWLRYCGSHGG